MFFATKIQRSPFPRVCSLISEEPPKGPMPAALSPWQGKKVTGNGLKITGRAAALQGRSCSWACQHLYSHLSFYFCTHPPPGPFGAAETQPGRGTVMSRGFLTNSWVCWPGCPFRWGPAHGLPPPHHPDVPVPLLSDRSAGDGNKLPSVRAVFYLFC